MKKLISLLLVVSQFAGLSIAGTTRVDSLVAKGSVSASGALSGASVTTSAGAVVGTTASVGKGSAPSSDAILEVTSTTKGLLPPRMTQTQRDSIGTPTAGLTIYNTTTNKLNVYNNASWVEVGSGSGGGGINYVTNSDFENNATTGFSTFADVAQADPVDGTGGSANVTFAATGTSPLRGTYSALFTKDAVNRQGQGFSYDFTIASADALGARVQRIGFEYQITSGTFANGDISVWIYDITNARLVQPVPYQILNSGLVEQWRGEFQPATNSTSYRLIWHVSSTSASAYTIKIDSVTVGPSEVARGAIITDWVSYTPTGSWVSNATYTGKWRRVGDSILLDVKISLSGAPTSTFLTVNLPTGLSIDTAKLAGTNAEQPHGDVVIYDSSAGLATPGKLEYASTTSLYVQHVAATSNNINGTTQAAPITFASGDYIYIRGYSLPIQGWSSSTQMSSDAGTRLVSFSSKLASSPTLATGTETTGQFDSINQDTHGGYNAAGHYYTIPEAGFYDLFVSTAFQNNATGGRYIGFRIDNETAGTYYGAYITSPALSSGANAFLSKTLPGLYLTAGQKIWVRLNQDSGTTLAYTDNSYSVFSIQKRVSNQQIAASESVSARYYTNSTQALNTGVVSNINYDVKDWDTHNAVTVAAGAYNAATGQWATNNWKFTAPISGEYEVVARASTKDVVATAVLQRFLGTIFKNGTLLSTASIFTSAYAQSASTGLFPFSGSAKVKLLAGEYIAIHADQNTGNNTTLLGSSPGFNSIEIRRVGNY